MNKNFVLSVGAELPTFQRVITLKNLVMYAGASDDFNDIHYDFDAAKKAGLQKPIVHGMLNAALCVKVVTDIIHPKNIRKINISFRKVVEVGESVTYGGRVKESVKTDNKTTIKFEVWAKKENGEIAVSGEIEAETCGDEKY